MGLISFGVVIYGLDGFGWKAGGSICVRALDLVFGTEGWASWFIEWKLRADGIGWLMIISEVCSCYMIS